MTDKQPQTTEQTLMKIAGKAWGGMAFVHSDPNVADVSVLFKEILDLAIAGLAAIQKMREAA